MAKNKKTLESSEDRREDRREDLRVHVFTVSAAMVGVCLTVIGIIRLVITNTGIGLFVDDMLSLDALLFMASCLFAYAALRARTESKTCQLENIADYLFIPAMVLMFGACVVITFSLL